MLETQRFLMSFWHSHNTDAKISSTHPLVYADRLRIRQPGDAGFALGAHVDGGSVERWQENGYGQGHVYDKIWQGRWEEYDPWEASCRVPAVADLYNGAGACSMFRMFQGWLSMSHTGPREGTLLVNPILALSTAYYLLRPFFEPLSPLSKMGNNTSRISFDTFLEPTNWRLETNPTSAIQGATPGYSQELNAALHPHLELDKTMVHVPKIGPGDYVAWHCDCEFTSLPTSILLAGKKAYLTNTAVHAVDKVHHGTGDSSVMYIPACSMTEANAEYVKRQRDTFLEGVPPPDFPGSQGESQHVGRATVDDLKGCTNELGLRTQGFAKLDTDNVDLSQGQQKVLQKANEILGLE